MNFGFFAWVLAFVVVVAAAADGFAGLVTFEMRLSIETSLHL